MGLYPIELEWKFTIKSPHKILVRRKAGLFIDRIEAVLDGDNLIMSRQAASWKQRGRHKFIVDDCPMEICWKWNLFGNPESIMVLANGEVIAQYGSSKAARSSEHAT